MTIEKIHFLETSVSDDSKEYIDGLRTHSPEILKNIVKDIPDDAIIDMCKVLDNYHLSIREVQIAFAISLEQMKCKRFK